MPNTQRPPELGPLPSNDGRSREALRVHEPNSILDDHILLTPPPEHATSNPLDALTFSYSPAQTSSYVESRQRENSAAYHQNGHHRGAFSSSGYDAPNLMNGLHIRTDMPPPRRSASTHSVDSEGRLRSSASAASLPRRAPSIRSHLHSTAGSISPGSTISSPQIAAMLDITPLPSPTMGAFETWKTAMRSRSRASSTSSRPDLGPPAYPPSNFTPASPRKKGYQSLKHTKNKSSVSEELFAFGDELRSRTRSVSEYVPEALAVPKPRHVAVSGSGPPAESQQTPTTLQREEYLGVQRGIASLMAGSPPVAAFADDIESVHEKEPASKRPKLEVFTVKSISTGQVRNYQSLRTLGQGTFSKVYLAVRQVHDRTDTMDYSQESVSMAGVQARSRRLAAVKVVEQGPAGGADAERIEVSLKREVDLLKAIKHPSVVHLKAFGNDASARALLVMNYCPGGDLFDVASTKLEVLTPSLVRRIFSELVSAVKYLHQKYIVHRDIKLESRSDLFSVWLIY